MAAACYESYTDFGDWPMSSGFATDWAKGNTGGQPVWLTVCWGTSPEGTMKSLLHAFARGIKGGGAPLSGEWDAAEIQQRGKGLRFVSQYGSLARDATPDGRVAILSRSCRQLLVPRGMYELHAMYYHLTRLGYPPALVSDDELLTGVPATVKMLVLVQEQIPLEPEIAAAIAAFQQRGGKVLAVGKSAVDVAGAAGRGWRCQTALGPGRVRSGRSRADVARVQRALAWSFDRRPWPSSNSSRWPRWIRKPAWP